MKQYRVQSSIELAAPAAAVHAIIADYHHRHPAILPKAYTLAVESGGTGAGTVFALMSKVLGTTRVMRMAVTEPAPGRVLVETGLAPGDPATTFTFDPLGPGRSRLTIATAGTVRGGVMGRLEGWATVWLLRRMYAEEFRNLARHLAAEPG